LRGSTPVSNVGDSWNDLSSAKTGCDADANCQGFYNTKGDTTYYNSGPAYGKTLGPANNSTAYLKAGESTMTGNTCKTREYQQMPATDTKDRQCATIMTCAADEYETSAPTKTTNRDCEEKQTCVQYKIDSGTGSDRDNKCCPDPSNHAEFDLVDPDCNINCKQYKSSSVCCQPPPPGAVFSVNDPTCSFTCPAVANSIVNPQTCSVTCVGGYYKFENQCVASPVNLDFTTTDYKKKFNGVCRDKNVEILNHIGIANPPPPSLEVDSPKRLSEAQCQSYVDSSSSAYAAPSGLSDNWDHIPEGCVSHSNGKTHYNKTASGKTCGSGDYNCVRFKFKQQLQVYKREGGLQPNPGATEEEVTAKCFKACSEKTTTPINGTWNDQNLKGFTVDLQRGKTFGDCLCEEEDSEVQKTTCTLENTNFMQRYDFIVPCEGQWAATDNCNQVCGEKSITETFNVSVAGTVCEFDNGEVRTKVCPSKPACCEGRWVATDHPERSLRFSWDCNQLCGEKSVTETFVGSGDCEFDNGEVRTKVCPSKTACQSCVGSWTVEDPCTQKCGDETKTLVYNVSQQPNDGSSCPAENNATKQESCNHSPCVVNKKNNIIKITSLPEECPFMMNKTAFKTCKKAVKNRATDNECGLENPTYTCKRTSSYYCGNQDRNRREARECDEMNKYNKNSLRNIFKHFDKEGQGRNDTYILSGPYYDDILHILRYTTKK